MKIIISPAKSLDFDSELNTKNFSNPKFLENLSYKLDFKEEITQ